MKCCRNVSLYQCKVQEVNRSKHLRKELHFEDDFSYFVTYLKPKRKFLCFFVLQRRRNQIEV